jgi:hypothetical protein
MSGPIWRRFWVCAEPDERRFRYLSDEEEKESSYAHPPRGIMRSGCVDPGTSRTFSIDTQTYNPGGPIQMPYEVRAEVTHNCRSHPVYVDKTLGWSRGIPYYVRGNNGNYSFWHTP